MRWSRTLILCMLCLNAYALSAQSTSYEARLSRIRSKVKFSYDPLMDKQISSALKNDRKAWENALGKAAYFLPGMQDSLKEYGLPPELAMAALGWSMFDQNRISDDGGSGFWQMRYIDAKRYGVYISSFVDMRRDPLVSTGAASRYFMDLYSEYGDWYISLAAFAMGEVEVNKAIRLAGGSKDYWKLHEHLPERYQHVIPDFIRATYIYHYYKEHNLSPATYNQDSTVTVDIVKWSSLYQVASAIDTEHKILQELNPIFKKDVVPNASRMYSIRIPADKLARFTELGDSVYRFPVDKTMEGEVDPAKADEHQQRNEVKEVPKQTQAASQGTNGTRVVYYTVRPGDYLGRIADIYDVGVSMVRRWNGLSGDRINVNQKLKIYVPASKYDTYSKYNGYSRSQLDEIIRRD